MNPGRINLVEVRDVPIEALRSPKTAIDMSSQAKVDRYMRIQDGLKNGDELPPIDITPGSRGIRVDEVSFDAAGSTP